MTRYVIVGAGAVGGGIGARLLRAGLDTVLVARGEHLAAMRRDGLRLRTPYEDVTVGVTAVGSVGEIELRTDDVIVVSTKTQQVLDVVPDLADAAVRSDGAVVGTAGDLLPVFLATNGVAAEDLAGRYLRRVFGICIWMPATHLRPGEVILPAVPMSGVLHLGRVPHRVAELTDHALLERMAAHWRQATFDVALPQDVMAWKYRKLIGNIGNVVDALVDDPRSARSVLVRADAEARRVLAAARLPVIDDATEAAARAQAFTIEPVPGLEDTRLGSSTWQSLSRGAASIETDFLNGEIVRIAHAHGVAAPVNTVLARLGRESVRERRGPGSLAAADLVAMVEAVD